jgi:hypothetical protein
MGGFAHVLAYKSPKTPFFAQKYLTRYTYEMFFEECINFKIVQYLTLLRWPMMEMTSSTLETDFSKSFEMWKTFKKLIFLVQLLYSIFTSEEPKRMLILCYISSSSKSYLKSEIRCNLSSPWSTSNVWIAPKVDLASAHPYTCVIPHAWRRRGGSVVRVIGCRGQILPRPTLIGM